jgi:hypothetical protein
MVDLCEILHFAIFPAICYFSLKRDCQYWSIGVDEDEETSMLGYANEVRGPVVHITPHHTALHASHCLLIT